MIKCMMDSLQYTSSVSSTGSDDGGISPNYKQ